MLGHVWSAHVMLVQVRSVYVEFEQVRFE